MLPIFFSTSLAQQFKVRLLIDDKTQFIWELKAIAIYSQFGVSPWRLFFFLTKRDEMRKWKSLVKKYWVMSWYEWSHWKGWKKARNIPTIYNFHNFLTCNYQPRFFFLLFWVFGKNESRQMIFLRPPNVRTTNLKKKNEWLRQEKNGKPNEISLS